MAIRSLNDENCSEFSCVRPPTLVLSINLLSTRLATGVGKAPGDAVHQQHHGWSLHAERLYRLSLLHAQQPHQCWLWQRVCEHGRREDLLHLHHAHGWCVYR